MRRVVISASGGRRGVITAPDVGGGGLIQAANMSYLGSFDLPHFAGTPEDTDHLVDFGGMGPGMGADGVSLYVGGYDFGYGLARFSIPSIGGTASVQVGMANTGSASLFDEATGNGVPVGGSLVWNNRVIVSRFGLYSEFVNHLASHTSAALDLTGFTTPQDNNGPIPRAVGGYMGVIDPAYRTPIGKPCFTGSGPRSIIANASHGPSLYAFDPDDVDGSGTIAVTTLLYYDADHLFTPFGAVETADTYQIGGVAWIGDSVVFIGTRGDGTPTYDQTEAEIDDPCRPTTSGWHDYPYELHAWAYEAADLLAVKNGTLQPWEPQPYADWTLPGFDGSPCGEIIGRGGCYDPATGRYYLCLPFSEAPLVHVYLFTP